TRRASCGTSRDAGTRTGTGACPGPCSCSVVSWRAPCPARASMIAPWSARDGRYWKRTLIGPHFPPLRLEDGYWDATLPTPELFHPDDEVWLRRSRLGPLMTRAAAGENPHVLVVEAGDGIDASAADRFWNDFVP